MPDVMKTLLLNPPSFENFDGGASSRCPGPHGHIKPDETLMASEDIDFVTRGEFDHSVVEYAHGKPLSQILGVSYRKDGRIVHNAERPQLHTEELDALPFATDIYKRDLEIERYNVPFLLH